MNRPVDASQKITLRNDLGYEVDVHPYGATVTSWRLAPHDDVLFLSSRVEFKEGKAIRGGIPLVFPQFGPGVLPSHGFARVMDWQVQSNCTLDNGAAELCLGLSIEKPWSEKWPHPVRLAYTVTLGSSLKTAFAVTNMASVEILFQEALHTYFRVSDIEAVEIPGFAGLSYLDNLNGRAMSTENRDVITIGAEIDRIYQAAPSRIEIRDRGRGRTIEVVAKGLHDAVVWNPWIEKSKSLTDLGAEDFKKFVCVESANIVPPVTVAPGATHQVFQEISCR